VAIRARPSIILMDLMMPRMDGWEAIRRLKADARTTAIAIIVLSACSDQDDAAKRAGCQDSVSKPCDLDQLAVVMRRVLQGPPPLSDMRR
jgi:two-component system cell cycle response regulator DivK